MDDIVKRLRDEISWEPQIGELLEQAAREIERLRWKVAVNRNIAQRLLAAVEKLRAKQPIDDRINELL